MSNHAPCCCMTAQQQLEQKNCPQLYWAFLVRSIWFLFWWCPLLSVDCFRKLCLSGTPLENSQAGWDLGNRMAKGCWFDVKWVCPMGTYAWGIQVFCSRWWFEVRWCLISWTAPFFGMPPHFIDILVSRSNTGQWLLLGTGKSKTKN